MKTERNQKLESAMTEKKPILCLDFDGVIHSYTSGWKGADVIPDPMTEGTAEFLAQAVEIFRVAIFSSRSGQPLGVEAMQLWLRSQLYKRMDRVDADRIYGLVEWPREKPPAMVTIDDRAIQFRGFWPPLDILLAFKTWQQEDRPQSMSLGGGSTDTRPTVNVLATGAVYRGWHDEPGQRTRNSPRRSS